MLKCQEGPENQQKATMIDVIYVKSANLKSENPDYENLR